MKDYRESHIEDRIVRQYEEEIYGKGSYDDLLWQWEKEILASEVELLRELHDSVAYLDFGCGTGRILAFLEDSVDGSTGVDISETMIGRARGKIHKSELLVADITRNDRLAGRAFDLITAFRIFLNAQPELRHAILNVLTPKLRDSESPLIFNVHGNLWSYRFFTKLWYRARGRNLNTFSYSQVKKLLRQHDLEIVRWYGFGVIPKMFYRLFSAPTMYKIDCVLAHIPLLKFISYNLIFVCKRKSP